MTTMPSVPGTVPGRVRECVCPSPLRAGHAHEAHSHSQRAPRHTHPLPVLGRVSPECGGTPGDALRALAVAQRAVADALEALASTLDDRSEENRAATPPSGALLSTPELAERLGCSRAKVHQLAQDPTAPVLWLGDSRRWNYDAVIAWLEARGRVANDSEATTSCSSWQSSERRSRKQPKSAPGAEVSPKDHGQNPEKRAS